MSDVKWIKIAENIFDDEKIILIESLPDGDAIIVIWFKLLCLAGKQNNGGVFLINDRIPYTDEMLATIFRRPLNTVRLALKTFEEFEMVEIISGVVTIPNWDKYQKRDAIDAKRERDKLYQAKCRQKQKLLAAQGSLQSKNNGMNAENGSSFAESTENHPDVRRLSDDLSSDGQTSVVSMSGDCQTTVVTTDNKTIDIETIDEKEIKKEPPEGGKKEEKKNASSPAAENKLSRDEAKKQVNDSELPKEVQDALIRWISYKEQMFGFGYTERGLHTLLKSALKNTRCYGTQAVLKTIQLSMDREWQGIIWEKAKELTAPEPFPTDHNAYKAAAFLDRERCKRLPTLSPAEEPTLQKWAACFNECHELDKHEWEEISRVLAFSQKHEFWSAKITDAYSFRRKYVNLLSEMPKSALPRPEAPPRRTCSISELVEYPEGSGNWMPPWEAEERRKQEE